MQTYKADKAQYKTMNAQIKDQQVSLAKVASKLEVLRNERDTIAEALVKQGDID